MKPDILKLEQRLEFKIQQHISDAKTDITRWVAGIAIAQIALLVGILVKLL